MLLSDKTTRSYCLFCLQTWLFVKTIYSFRYRIQ